MNILVTGGCGFIGTRFVSELFTEGTHFIRVIDNLSVGTREDLGLVCKFDEITPSNLDRLTKQNKQSAVELVVGDIIDHQLALNVTKNIDLVVHLAANTGVWQSVEDPRTDCMTNVIGTLNYLEAVRTNHVNRFILASSGAPVGECEPPIHEEKVPHPSSPYGASKLACEGYCSAYFRSFGIDTVALRFGNIYGPGATHKSSVVAKFIKQAIAGEKLEIYGDGKQTRDFIYIDDLISAIRLAANADGIGGEIFQIASSAETSVLELVVKLDHILTDNGIRGVKVYHNDPRPGDVIRNYSDTSKALRILGWKTKVGLVEGLKRTVEWFANRNLN